MLFPDSPKWTQKSWRESVSWASLSQNFADDFHHGAGDDDGQDQNNYWDNDRNLGKKTNKAIFSFVIVYMINSMVNHKPIYIVGN